MSEGTPVARHDLLEGKTNEERKTYPLYSGGMAYFRDAWLRIAHVSYIGNQQHNGEGHPLQWTRGKSADHKDCAARHLATGDEEEHLASMAWRACADLQIFLEHKYNIKPPPGCK